MPRATSDSWQTLPAPGKMEPLGYHATFTADEMRQLARGFIPRQMEDKWFVYFDDGWLRLHRSWTGILIYWLRLAPAPDGARVTESWVNRDPDQYGETSADHDRTLLDFLIRRLLLGHNPEFPLPPA